MAEIKSRYGLPVMKVIGVAEAADLAPIDLYAQVADQIMIDAKAPKGAKLPGGNGVAFDGSCWRARNTGKRLDVGRWSDA